MTPELRNWEATILHNAFPHKLHKAVRNDGWSPTALHIMHILSTCCKLSAPATHHLLANDVRPKDLAQLTTNSIGAMLRAFKNFITDSTSQSAGAGIRASIFNRCKDCSSSLVDLGFTTHLTSQVIRVAFYSERVKSDKFCSEALISA